MAKCLTWKPEEHSKRENYRFIMQLLKENCDEMCDLLFEYCQERDLV